MDKMREDFEKWLEETHGLYGEDVEWQEKRNCYAKFGIHLAYQAWQEAANSPVIPDGWVAISEDMLADYRDVKNAEVDNFKASYASHCYIPGSRWQRDLADLTEELAEIDKILAAAPKPEK